MTDTALTIRNFLTDDAHKPIAKALDFSTVTAAVTAATAAIPGAASAQISGMFEDALDGLFQVSLGDVLAASWGKAAALRDAILATRKDPALVAIVPLIDHKITSKHKPHVDVMVAGKSAVQIGLDITLNLVLKGVILEIQNGEIVGVKGGACTGDGALAFLDKPFLQKKSPEFKLPGALAFTKKPSAAV